MSLSMRPMAMKIGLGITVAALAAGSTVAGVAAASASSTIRPAATTTTIDHQLCYQANAPGFQPPGNVLLQNEFSTTPFAPQVGPAVIHCNPVAKTLPSGQVFPITNPNAHLLCFSIAESTQPTPLVQVANQFGTATLQPSQPNLLCLPSWKSLTGPPRQKAVAPPGLGHFACYPVKPVKGAYRPPPVMLQDEFTPKPVSAQVSPEPAELCVPTQKTVNGKVYKIIKPRWHLLCFPVSPTPIITPVFDKNQFGNAPVNIGQTIWLCPPSTLKILG